MPRDRPSIAEKRRSFRALHESGCFVISKPPERFSVPLKANEDEGRAIYSMAFLFVALTLLIAFVSLAPAGSKCPLAYGLDQIHGFLSHRSAPVEVMFWRHDLPGGLDDLLLFYCQAAACVPLWRTYLLCVRPP